MERTLPLILVMPESTEASAVAALKARVNDYLRPPFSFDELIGSVNRCLSDAGTFGPSVMPHGESSAGLAVQPMIGQSQSLRTIIAYIAKDGIFVPGTALVVLTGVYLFATAIFSYCPLYSGLGLTTIGRLDRSV